MLGLSTTFWMPVIGSWLDSEKAKALASGVSESAAELVAGQAAHSQHGLLPYDIGFVGILFAFRNKLEEEECHNRLIKLI